MCIGEQTYEAKLPHNTKTMRKQSHNTVSGRRCTLDALGCRLHERDELGEERVDGRLHRGPPAVGGHQGWGHHHVDQWPGRRGAQRLDELDL